MLRAHIDNSIERRHNMSSFVCGDHTILAIVQGMRAFGMISKRSKAEALDTAEALRVINEVRANPKWTKCETLPEGASDEDKAALRSSGYSRLAFFLHLYHRPVEATVRDYCTGEILQACECWLYQVDTDAPSDFDYLTMIAAVKELKKKILAKGIEDGNLKRVNRGFLGWKTYENQDGEWVDIAKAYAWDAA